MKTGVHGLSHGIIYMILDLAIIVELQLVTGGQTDTQ